jgi:predicted alpha/beta-fold hydrolase
MFLNTMKPKALLKLKQYPGLFDASALQSARDLDEFDNVFTAPLHGYRDTRDYWSRASAKPHLHSLRIPALIVHAQNDPFVPAWSLPTAREVGPSVTLWQPRQGGHVGFASGAPPGQLQGLPTAFGQWLQQHLG